MKQFNNLLEITKLIRYYILIMTTRAGSGHATSSLSAVEAMTVLFFKYLRFDLKHPENLGNDRVIFSKGHASPLFYALYKVAGAISEKELMDYRTFESQLEGHPTMRFPFTEAPTGSLGQGLSVGVGEALALRARISNYPIIKLSNNPIKNNHYTLDANSLYAPKVFVLLGDGEMAEGQVWEALQIASFYKLNNLISICDMNRLGQSQQTLYGTDIQGLARRVNAMGWRTYVVENGHDIELVDKAYSLAIKQSENSTMPAMILFKTIKGKGVSQIEDKNGYHGITLKPDELKQALKEIGKVDLSLKANILNLVSSSLRSRLSFKESNENREWQSSIDNLKQEDCFVVNTPRNDKNNPEIPNTKYKIRENVSTRKAFGESLVKLGEVEKNLVVLDADVQNSTYTNLFNKQFPERFFQMFIAEQNMVSVALGIAKMGLIPVISTFSSFLTRAADQIRMAHLSGLHIIFNGTHGGVSIGADGPSQMGLEDISLFRTLPNTTVLYPADAVATEKLIFESYNLPGLVYLRSQRPETPVIYDNNEKFPIGGSKMHVSCITYHVSSNENMTHDTITIIASGITVVEALKAQELLNKQGISIDVIDCYSIKPIDAKTLLNAAQKSMFMITVEDHYITGGLGDAVLDALSQTNHPPIYKLGITKTPKSGKMEELFDHEGISASEIVKTIRGKIGRR